MMRSQKSAPDLLDKGVHFNVGKSELKAVPDHAGGLVFRPVHPGMAAKNPAAYEAAVRQADKALESAEFREWLAKHAGKGLEMAKVSGSAKALEFKFLLGALRRLQ